MDTRQIPDQQVVEPRPSVEVQPPESLAVQDEDEDTRSNVDAVRQPMPMMHDDPDLLTPEQGSQKHKKLNQSDDLPFNIREKMI